MRMERKRIVLDISQAYTLKHEYMYAKINVRESYSILFKL